MFLSISSAILVFSVSISFLAPCTVDCNQHRNKNLNFQTANSIPMHQRFLSYVMKQTWNVSLLFDFAFCNHGGNECGWVASDLTSEDCNFASSWSYFSVHCGQQLNLLDGSIFSETRLVKDEAGIGKPFIGLKHSTELLNIPPFDPNLHIYILKCWLYCSKHKYCTLLS